MKESIMISFNNEIDLNVLNNRFDLNMCKNEAIHLKSK